MKVLAQDGKIILYGLLGGVKVEGPLLGMMLAKRAQIRASTLMSRSPEYKGRIQTLFLWILKSLNSAITRAPDLLSKYGYPQTLRDHKLSVYPKITLHFRKRTLHIFKKTLHILKKTLHFFKKTLHFLKITLHFLKKSLNYLKKSLSFPGKFSRFEIF